MRLEELQPGLIINGIIPDQPVTVIDVKWRGRTAIELYYKRANGQPAVQLLFRNDEAQLEILPPQPTWQFKADPAHFRLATEAYRIRLAHLFDPILAVHASLIEPLPHQITAVYGDMLPRQPLRFLLADDPGAGKTVMAGLLLKELAVRGDVKRCLICVPGNLATQWQDELWFKFQFRFDIFSRETFESAVGGNPFAEKDLVIVRLDQMARSETLMAKLERSDWDLIIVDEAHKMSAHFWGGDVEESKRYRLGKLLGQITRHFLLMTATPHNGKEEDFQLFLKLLDADRFEGRFRDGAHEVDISDLIRRMIKEDLFRFDGRKLFPERKAYTVNYPLSAGEQQLYEAVTEYVRREFNRADLLDDKRRGTVGFALTILQRRLASSPEAIYKSLQRRRERLEKRLNETKALLTLPGLGEDVVPDFLVEELEDVPAGEVELLEEQVVDSATAALTIAELQAEIETLQKLEAQAFQVRHSGQDRKWEELAALLQDNEHIQAGRKPHKLVIFTEHRDTLRYLSGRITTLFGQSKLLATIDGSTPRDQRRAIEDRFRNDPDTLILLATDAAGEGVNLQRAHLMINYDLPWNPNRLEQRFGRIHRIGQNEICHLWNLIAGQTREGYVYARLLRKLEAESQALQGKVFNVLGQLFSQNSLHDLLIEAIREGDRPEVRARLEERVDLAVDQEKIRDLLESRSLVTNTLDTTQVMRLRQEMERFAAGRLQPYYIKNFFVAAFTQLEGAIREREAGRYRLGHVPARIRNRAKELGIALSVGEKYDQVCFDKTMAQQEPAEFLCPGHPLLDSVLDLILEKYGPLLNQGAVFIDNTDPSPTPRLLFLLQQTVRNARPDKNGNYAIISQELHFVEMEPNGTPHPAGNAPHLDYQPATPEQLEQLQTLRPAAWETAEEQLLDYAIEQLIPPHLQRVQTQKESHITKILAAVHERLTKEISYWDRRASELSQQEKSGRINTRLNAAKARQRAEDLSGRLAQRTAELNQERQLAAALPLIIGRALIVPIGFFGGHQSQTLTNTRLSETLAMQAVMQAEANKGHYPQDVSSEKRGYDIESFNPNTGRVRLIEVKGRQLGAETVTVTHNEILTALNARDNGTLYLLAIVQIDSGRAAPPRYILHPFNTEPDPNATSVNYHLPTLLAQSYE